MIEGFVHLVASQVITRLLTFSLNLATARSLTPEAYGVAAVQFHLINTTILFISREGFRRACLRIDQASPRATQRVLRIAALTLPCGALLAAAVTAVLQRTVGGQDGAYRQALGMQGLAAFVEILSEPLYILAACRLLFGLRVGVETAAMSAKGVVTLVLVRRPGMPPAIAFSWAQLAYAGVTLAGYSAYFLPHFLRLQPSQAAAANRSDDQHATPRHAAAATAAADKQAGSDKDVLRLSGTFTLQAVEKLVLAEGSKMAVAAFQEGREQGVYGLVQGLGSIVVRTLFQPLEEAAFVAFSKQRGQAAPGPAQLHREARLLAVLVRCVTTAALVAAAFGPAYAHLLLLLLYSSRWADSEAPVALGAYSLYLLPLAANGILEAFVHSVADERQLHAVNVAMVGFTAAHATLSIAAVKAGGACGLIVADGINMLLRIAYCLVFTRRRFVATVPGFSLGQLLPSRPTVTALASAAAITCSARVLLLPASSMVAQVAAERGIHLVPAAMAAQLDGQPLLFLAAAHIAVGAACLAAVTAAIALHERSIVSEVRQLRKGSKGS